MHFETQLLPTQNGRSGSLQSVAMAHSTHALDTQIGVVVPAHAPTSVALHGLHGPPAHAGLAELWHSGAVPEPRSPAHAVQTLPEHTGFAGSLQSVGPRQATHMLVAVLQTGVAVPVQALLLVALHCTQAPLLAAAGSVTHTGVVWLHSNVVVGGPKSPSQPTHVFVAALHEPVAPVQAPVFVASHWTHPPSVHTGKPELGQAAAPPEPKLPEHGPQPPPAVQMGRPGGQFVTPGTHV